MTWEEFKNKQAMPNTPYGFEKTDIECPVCGELIYKDVQHVLTSYPPQRMYRCFNCEWLGYAYE